MVWTLLVFKIKKAKGGYKLEFVKPYPCFSDLFGIKNKVVVRNIPTVYLYPFVEFYDKRRDKSPRNKPAFNKDIRYHSGGRAFTVRPCDMDTLKGILRIAEPFANLFYPLKRRRQPELAEGMDKIECFVICHGLTSLL